MANKNLNKAKEAKKDEFYTQLDDINNELKHYREHFRGKTVLCNCDDPRVSNFFTYFAYNFEFLGLKKLITTCYKNQNMDLFSQNQSEQAVYLIYEGDKNGNHTPDANEIGVMPLKGDGDFRSKECIELLKEADIVVTNPPFSLFREYVAQLIEYDKKFLIIGHQNAIKYKEIFPLIQQNKLWLGYGFKGGAGHFISHYEDTATAGDHREGMIRVSGVTWFTNLEIKKRHEFEFVIDDRNIYHYAADFRSPQAKAQFRNYLQLKESYNQQQNKLENIRIQYSRANQNERNKMAPAILDLEKRVLQLANEVDRTAIQVRKLEKQTIK